MGPCNLTDVLRRAAAQAPSLGIGYLQDNGSAIIETYPALLQRATRVLGVLQHAGLRAGDYLVLAAARNEDFVPAFWACQLGGIIAVPLAPPRANANDCSAADKLAAVRGVLGQPWVLVDEQPVSAIHSEMIILSTELDAGEHPACFHSAELDETAFIQFSSGSTGEPKGVVLTQRNVLANLQGIAAGLQVKPGDAGLNWMPLYHDMGLVGFHLAAVFTAIAQFHMPAASFIRAPLAWLEALDRHRATITASPSFGLSLVLAKLDAEADRKSARDLDLTHVRLVLNGAEPISVNLMQRFMDRMQAFGLSAHAMLPVYGLAEATLAVTIAPLAQPPAMVALDREELANHRAVEAVDSRVAVHFVMEGSPVLGCRVRVVSEDDQEVSDENIGHIQIAGDNVTQRYLGVANSQHFCGEWLRTGDLGFLRKGQLCITGRAKDIIFIAGRNYYPHDLENAAQKVPGVMPGRVAICAFRRADSDQDRIAVFLATRNVLTCARHFLDVRRNLQRTCGISVDVMVPLKPTLFPKSSSGKLQRYKLANQLAAGLFDEDILRLDELMAAEAARQSIPPQTTTEKVLHSFCCDQLQLPPESVGIHATLDELGATSLDLLGLMTSIERGFRVHLHSEMMAANPTIEKLAAFLDRSASVLGGGGAQKRYFRG